MLLLLQGAFLTEGFSISKSFQVRFPLSWNPGFGSGLGFSSLGFDVSFGFGLDSFGIRFGSDLHSVWLLGDALRNTLLLVDFVWNQ